MARQKGSANFAGTLEVLAGGPIDSRSIVPTLADLTVASNFPYPYQYMEVRVTATGKKYKLVGNDLTVAANWVEIEETGGSQITVDSALSTTSENPVQNKVITTEINKKANATALDSKADLVDGKVPAGQLPSYVDDVIEGYAKKLYPMFNEVLDSINTTLNLHLNNTANDHRNYNYVFVKSGNTGCIYEVSTTDRQAFKLKGTMAAPMCGAVTYGGYYGVLIGYLNINLTQNPANLPTSQNMHMSGDVSLLANADAIYYTGDVDVSEFSGEAINLNVPWDIEFYEEQSYTTLITPESGKIYVDLIENRSYRWSGSKYIRVDEGVTLGETADTAYRGDRGKVAYETSQANAAAIGDLSTLTTTDKTDVVSAVNELESEKLTGDVLTAQDIEDIKAAFQANVSQQWVMTQHFNRDNIYSTDEKLVGCWIDGKPLYKKTVDCGSMPNAPTKNVAHGISNLDKTIDINGFWYDSSHAGGKIPQPTEQYASSNWGVRVTTNPTNIVIVTSNSGWSSYNTYVTLYYTKTTDAANSFKLADENDYSTEEHVVGTWIDGRPIYQKTISVPLVNATATSAYIYGHSTNTLNVKDFKGAIIKDSDPIESYLLGGSVWDGTKNNPDVSIAIGTGNNIEIRCTTDWRGYTAYITLQYTKTTD